MPKSIDRGDQVALLDIEIYVPPREEIKHVGSP